MQFINNTVRKSASGIHTDNTGATDVISGNHVSDSGDGSWGIWVFVPYAGVTVKDNDVDGMDVWACSSPRIRSATASGMRRRRSVATPSRTSKPAS